MRLGYSVKFLVAIGVLGGAGIGGFIALSYLRPVDSAEMGSMVSAQEAKPEIKLEKIKAADVEKAVAAHKGKVVVVDVWASFCAPCMKKFPHLVQLHKELAKEGLVCISLSVDIDDEGYAKALEFLQKQGAAFPNYVLVDTEENKDKLEKTLEHTACPIVHVFDRNGKKIQTWDTKIEEDKIDALIKKLLNAK
jgi:thiol-disulfide isomerase/thioredoxin